VVESAEARAALLQDPQIATTLQKAAQCDLGLVGIGSTGEDMVLFQLGYCNYDAVHDLRSRGAVGDIIGHFFDIYGKPVACGLEERLIALSLEQLHALPTVIAVAGGVEKTGAILGALRGGHANVLVTDMEAAQAVLAASHDTGPADSRSDE